MIPVEGRPVDPVDTAAKTPGCQIECPIFVSPLDESFVVPAELLPERKRYGIRT
jgi:hypothetical protein